MYLTNDQNEFWRRPSGLILSPSAYEVIAMTQWDDLIVFSTGSNDGGGRRGGGRGGRGGFSDNDDRSSGGRYGFKDNDDDGDNQGSFRGGRGGGRGGRGGGGGGHGDSENGTFYLHLAGLQYLAIEK